MFETRDVIIVASVSCIYGLGDPVDYQEMMLSLRPGMQKSRDAVMKKLINMQYTRNEIDFKRGTFRAKGDILEIYPSSQSESAVRVEFWGDEIEKITEINPLTGKGIGTRMHILIPPASQYVTSKDKMEKAIKTIEEELEERIEYFKSQNKLIEAQRIEERTNFDIEMMKETGFCSGIENYSRHISQRPAGSPPYTLFDYFPDDFLLLIDESHATIPQVRAMYNGDRSRKESLVNYGFRLPSAFDNRPLKFSEFEERLNQVIFVSATPAEYEKEKAKDNVVEQIIRPTGLLDPKVIVKPVTNQVDDLIEQIRIRTEKKERVLVTTLTKKMAEDLSTYLAGIDIKVKYMHSDTKALERMEIIRDLRLGQFDVLVGINLLREGLDIPEVSLVAILDADKEGFLRSERSLIQTIGRAARNTNGKVIMYADELTESMEKAISETNRRRKIQEQYNKEHNITPKTIQKSVRDTIKASYVAEVQEEYKLDKDVEIKDIISTGVPMEAEVSPQLLVNIFVPKTPLHDGAVIISNNKIAAAACVLPLADDKDIAQELGTRHRAAIGISKESDSIVVVVSEETGKISVAKDGTLIADVREDVLKKILISNVVTKRFTTEKKERKHRIIKQKENKEKQQDNKNEDK